MLSFKYLAQCRSQTLDKMKAKYILSVTSLSEKMVQVVRTAKHNCHITILIAYTLFLQTSRFDERWTMQFKDEHEASEFKNAVTEKF